MECTSRTLQNWLFRPWTAVTYRYIPISYYKSRSLRLLFNSYKDIFNAGNDRTHSDTQSFAWGFGPDQSATWTYNLGCGYMWYFRRAEAILQEHSKTEVFQWVSICLLHGAFPLKILKGCMECMDVHGSWPQSSYKFVGSLRLAIMSVDFSNSSLLHARLVFCLETAKIRSMP